MLKPLRSCSRCRKNKIKCDSAETRPRPCSSCSKRGLTCTLDYVVPPKRSDELKKLHQSVSCVKHSVDRLLQNAVETASYAAASMGRLDMGMGLGLELEGNGSVGVGGNKDVQVLGGSETGSEYGSENEIGWDGGSSSGSGSGSGNSGHSNRSSPEVTWSSIKKSLSGVIPSRIIKVNESKFLRLMLNRNCLMFNNFELDIHDLEEVLLEFSFIVRSVLQSADKSEEELPPLDNIGQLLLSKEGSVYLVSIINFYFDIPNFDYLEFYDHVTQGDSQMHVSELWLFCNVILYGPAYFSPKVSHYSLPSICIPLQLQCIGDSMSNDLRPAFAKLYYSSQFKFQCPKLYLLQEKFSNFQDDPLLQLIQFRCKPQRIVPGHSSTKMSLSQLSICQYNDQR